MTIQPTELIPIRPTIDAYLLDHSDRCDRCGARAYVHTIIAAGGQLYWCRHHWVQYRRQLLAKSLYINDETRALFAGVKDDGHVVPGKEVSLPPRKTFG